MTRYAESVLAVVNSNLMLSPRLIQTGGMNPSSKCESAPTKKIPWSMLASAAPEFRSSMTWYQRVSPPLCVLYVLLARLLISARGLFLHPKNRSIDQPKNVRPANTAANNVANSPALMGKSLCHEENPASCSNSWRGLIPEGISIQ